MLATGFQTTLHLTRASQLETKPWSGGTTTELLRLPATSSLEAQDFAARLSTATVERDGNFTRFEGYTRHLMLVSGAGLELDIDGRTHRLAQPYEQKQFLGSASVQARLLNGTVTDFNLIVRGDTEGAIQALSFGRIFSTVQPKVEWPHRDIPCRREDVLWSPTGHFEVEIGRERVEVKAGDVFRVHHDMRPCTLAVRSLNGEVCQAVLASIAVPVSEYRR